MSDADKRLNGLGDLTYFKASTPNETFSVHLKSIPEQENLHVKLDRIEEKIDSLTRKIDLIFGNNFVINGQFVDLKDFKKMP